MTQKIKIRAWDKHGNQLPDFLFPDDLISDDDDIFVKTWVTYYSQEDVDSMSDGFFYKIKVGKWKGYNYLSEGVNFEVIE